MDLYIFKSLLQRLLELCRRWACRSLHALLRIYLALSKRRTVRDKHNKSDDEKDGLKGLPGPNVTSTKREGIDERSAVIACSSMPMPRKPPPARKYTRHTTIDSYIGGPTSSSSPTSMLHESPGAMSPSSYTMGERSLVEEPASPLDIYTAEPARFIVPPVKPFKSSLPSLSSRYDRKIPMYVRSFFLILRYANLPVSENNKGPWTFGPLETMTVYE